VTAAGLLQQLSELGITLSVEGDALRYRAPKGQLTAELKAAISARKAELVDLLRTGAHAGRLEFVRDPNARFEPFPLTDLQQAYLVGERDFYSQSTVANLYQRYRAPRLDLDRFRAAALAVVAAHDVLRLVMLPDGRQRVLPQVSCSVLFEDLRGQTDAQANASVSRMAEQLSSRLPALDTGPTWNLGVQRVHAGDIVHVAVRLLAFDAVTLYAVYRDLMGFYGSPDYAPPLPKLGYRDYVLGLERFRASPAYQRSLAFWRERVPSLQPAPDLPRVRVPPTGPAPALTRLSGRLSPGAWRKLREQALSFGRPINTVLCAVYADTLARWARVPSFSLNMLSANRPAVDAETAQVVGNCSTTSVVSVTGQGETFAERAQILQRELYSVLDHNVVSGVEVTRQWARQRAFGEEPPLPVVFSSGIGLVNGTSTFELLVAHPDFHLEEARLSTPQVWLDHQVMEERGELVFNWDYSAARYPAGLVEDMFEHYRAHLLDLSERPSAWQQRRSPLPSRQLAARRRANDTRLELPGGTLYSLFEQAARATPERLAISSTHASLSYAQAREQAWRVRQTLEAHGVRPGDLVGIHLPKTPDQVVATLGVLQAGAAYLPLDWKLPPARVRQILHHAQARLVLVPEASAELSEALSAVCVVPMPTGAAGAESAAGAEPSVEVADSAVAYVIYTSGSTGQPKGVVIDHRGAVNTIRDVNRRFDVTSEDRVLALSSLGFDLSVFDIFGAFAAGAAVVVPREEETPNPALWLEAVEQLGATVWSSVPALLEMALDYLGERAEPLAKLRLLMLSGDWLPLGLVRRIHHDCPNARLVCLGGATEASIWSNYFDVRAVDPSWTSVPYGFPLANQTFTVLDAQGNETPTWVFGDLYIGGLGLAKGYLNDPEKTAASFVEHPSTGERLYRTGDRACYMPDGALEFGGREDAQVKVRGFRVELGEIESVLGEQPGIEAAVALVHGGGSREQRLLVFVVTSLDDAELESVRQGLANRLPSYMVPASLLPILKLPLSANGKVDRAALQQLAAARPVQAKVRSLPRSSTEQQLAELWREIIGVEQLETADDFFALGGNSLQAVRLFSAIERRFGLRLPLSSLFQNRTLEAQAAFIEKSGVDGQGRRQPSSLVPLRAGGAAAPILALFHPVGGDVLCYEELASRLPSDVTVLGLRSAGLEGHSAPRQALETTAADYVALLSAAHPARPIHLAGWSLGGVLAYECARQLRAAGHVTGQLLLIDSWLGRIDVAPRSEAAMLAGFFNDLLGGEGDVEELARAASGAAPLSALLASLTAAGKLPSELRPDRAAALCAVYSANMRALEQYRPEPYDGDVTLIRASVHADDDFSTLEPFWRRAPTLLSRPWRFLELPLNHYQIMRGTALKTIVSAIAEACVPSEVT
jgi:amino acid adenylation domain-containing protein